MSAMIGMCRQVKTAIVAEMIETQKQAQSLLALGVEFGQGYYFGKPGDTLALLSPLRAGARILDRAHTQLARGASPDVDVFFYILVCARRIAVQKIRLGASDCHCFCWIIAANVATK
jgi:hypothetical protein